MFPLETIVARAKRRGFVYPWSDIYGGLANARDYGPYGSLLKKNIADARVRFFVQSRDDMILMDSQILMHPRVREASGHVAWFNDPLIDDKKTGERFRADKLIEDKIGEMSHRYSGVPTSREKWGNEKNILDTYGVANLIPESRTFEQMKAFIVAEIPNNPNKKKEKAERTDVRKFSMMFSTHQGVIEDDANKVRLRPETAQGIFVNFKNVLDTTRMRLPFGIAQIGKAFRNEITPGNFLYRTREFEQMEIEYFVENDREKAFRLFDGRKETCMERRQKIVQFKPENLRFREHEQDELSHYSAGTFDVEFQYPRGWGELQWLAYRTDFDLRQHQEFSGKDLQYQDPQTGQRFIPHVIEPSFGLSRTVLAAMLDCYDEEKYPDAHGQEETRVVVKFPYQLAPVKVALFPLIKKDEKQVELAKSIYRSLTKHRVCEYDDGGAIGKRYRRQDEIGTPRCITVDHTSVEDGSVTVRERDDMKQIRLSQEELVPWIQEKMCEERGEKW